MMLYSDGIVLIEKQQDTKMCRECYATNEGYRTFCKNCGEKL